MRRPNNYSKPPLYYLQWIVNGEVKEEINRENPVPLPLARKFKSKNETRYKPGFLRLKGVYL